MNDTTNGAGKIVPAPAPGAKAAQETVRLVWTSKEQAEYVRLGELRARVLAQNRQPVDTVARAIYESVANRPAVEQPRLIADELINRADFVTMALKPFVDGEGA